MLLRLLKGGKTALKDKALPEPSQKVTINESMENNEAQQGKGGRDDKYSNADRSLAWKRDGSEVLTKTEVDMHTDASSFLDSENLERLKDLLDFQDMGRLEKEFKRISSLGNGQEGRFCLK